MVPRMAGLKLWGPPESDLSTVTVSWGISKSIKCCGAGCDFWTIDRASKWLWDCVALGVLGRCGRAFSFVGLIRKLPVWTCKF